MSSASPLGVYLLAFGVSIGAVLSPGPVTAAIISEAPRRGWKVGPLVALGHTSLEFGMVALIAMGLSSNLVPPSIHDAIAVGGGVVLIGLGLMYLVGLQRRSFHLNQAAGNLGLRSPLALVALGVVTTITNPFWFAWWLTVAAGFISQMGTFSILAVGVFYLGHISADYAWDTLLSVSASYGSRWLNDRLYQALIFITACFMLYLGGVFLLNGVR